MLLTLEVAHRGCEVEVEYKLFKLCSPMAAIRYSIVLYLRSARHVEYLPCKISAISARHGRGRVRQLSPSTCVQHDSRKLKLTQL